MTPCKFCEKPMELVTGCTANEKIPYPDREILDPLPFAPCIEDGMERCAHCFVVVGERHHVSCDLERCPRCKDYLASCPCMKDPEDAEANLYLGTYATTIKSVILQE